MPPNGSTASSFLEGLSAGFARQNVAGAIREGRKIDEERLKKKEFENDVRDFQFSIGDSPSAKKNFQAMAKINPGWDRDQDTFRKFVSNYHKLDFVQQGIDRAANLGVFGDVNDPATQSVINDFKKSAVGDAEGMGKMITMMGVNHRAGKAEQETKAKAAAQKVERENTINGLALQMRNSGDPRAFEQTLRTARVSDGDIFEIRKAAESFKVEAKAPTGPALKSGDILAPFKGLLTEARETTDAATIKRRTTEIAETHNPEIAAAFEEEATGNVDTKAQAADRDRKQKIRQGTAEATALSIVAEYGEDPTEIEVEEYLQEHAQEISGAGTSVNELRQDIKDKVKLNAAENRAKGSTLDRSSDFITGLTSRGSANTKLLLATALAGNIAKYNDKLAGDVRTFEGNPGVISDGIINLPNGVIGSFLETSRGNYASLAETIGGRVRRTRVVKNKRGDMVPATDEFGNSLPMPISEIRAEATSRLQEGVPDKDGNNPITKVRDLTLALRRKLQKVKGATIDSGRTRGASKTKVHIGNPDSPEGQLIQELDSILAELKETDFGKQLEARGIFDIFSTKAALDTGEYNENLSIAAENLMLYENIKEKYKMHKADIFPPEQ